MHPTQKKARIAGLWYLLLAFAGFFSLMYVPSKLMVHGNAAATVQNILRSQLLFRIDMLSGLASSVIFLFLALALHDLFKAVDEQISVLMVILVVIQVPNAFVGAVNQGMALELAQGNTFMSVFAGPQREALAMLFLQLNHYGVLTSQLFWGLWLFPLAILIVRSRFLPKALGVWLFITGIAYVALWVTGFLLPQHFNLVNKMMFPVLLGEVAFMLWLLLRGARVPTPPS